LLKIIVNGKRKLRHPKLIQTSKIGSVLETTVSGLPPSKSLEALSVGHPTGHCAVDGGKNHN
jgi:hypothetical protein